MIRFKDFIEEEITEQYIDELIESLEWEDIIDLYDTEDLILEDITSTERIKMGQAGKTFALEKFSPERLVSNHAELYKSLLSR